jgi:hypothetical protein
MKRLFTEGFTAMDIAEPLLSFDADKSPEHVRQFMSDGNLGVIDPVDVHFHSKAKGTDISSKELAELRQYMYAAIHNAILDHYSIVRRPGPRVARIRIALTDVEKSSPALNVIPHTKLMGAGLGGASMEGEVLDSITGEQIAAVVQSQKGKKLSLAGLSKWGDAKAVMDGWAQSFKERLDEARIR